MEFGSDDTLEMKVANGNSCCRYILLSNMQRTNQGTPYEKVLNSKNVIGKKKKKTHIFWFNWITCNN